MSPHVARRLVRSLIVVLLVALAGRLLCLQGCVAPVRIASGSMAPQLDGVCHAVRCEDCSIAFSCDAENPSPTGNAVCPNCGHADNRLDPDKLKVGERVVVDRWPYIWRAPRRWELAAFQDPANSDRVAVKRVVGLPNELVGIRRGDLYIDGEIFRKSIEAFREVAILVFDNRYRPPDDRCPPRWAGDNELTAWRPVADGFRFDRRTDGAADWDWLTYRHWRCYASPHARTDESPVLDSYGYNQGVSRELHVITDLVLECNIDVYDAHEVALLVHDGHQPVRIELDFAEQRGRLIRGGRSIRTVELSALSHRQVDIEFGTIDSQIVLAIGKREVVRTPYSATGPLQPTSRPIGIGCRRGSLDVADVRVLRDLYYLDPPRLGTDWRMPAALSENEWFVLGDNAPISEDSRSWPKRPITRKLFSGRVLQFDDGR